MRAALHIAFCALAVGNKVLEGNWGGDYSDGTAPSVWGGSNPIYEQYMAKKQPVKFGQVGQRM